MLTARIVWFGVMTAFWVGITPSDAAALTIATSVDPADGWRTIAPVGNLEGQTLAVVGLDWESTHAGWNTSLAFDDSDAAGWHTPVARDVAQYGSVATNAIWADAPQFSGDTPAYFRKVFMLDAEPAFAFFGGQVGLLDSVIDDDAQIYINGALVYDDQDGVANQIPFTDVTGLLHAGENLIAVKAHDSFGVDEHFHLALEITPIPEPGTLGLVALGLAGYALTRDRARMRRGR